MTSRTRILLLFDNNGNEYVSRIHEAVNRSARALGFPVHAENLFTSRKTLAEVLEPDTFAGIILTAPLSDDRHMLSQIEQRGLPCVRIAPMLDPDRGCTVVMDEYDAARAITDHLLNKGHRRIGFVRGPKVHLVSMRRYNGYANALGGKGLRIDPSLIVLGDFSRQSGREQAATLFAAKPTAITDHLLNKGHRRIGFVRGPKVHLVSMRRYNGYANALGGKGLRIDPSLIVLGDFSRQSGREQAATLFAAKPTAIFASNDEMAIGIIDAAKAVGIDIPGDISLAGFDDNTIARSVRPRLTSVRQPLEEMGEAACKLLVERIRRPASTNEHRQIPFEIMERESVIEYVAA